MKTIKAEKTGGGVTALASAVVLKAIRDATATRAARHQQNAYIPTVEEISDARLFCTEENGEWAVMRAFWCDAAQVHPDDVREKVLATLLSRRIAHSKGFTASSAA